MSAYKHRQQSRSMPRGRRSDRVSRPEIPVRRALPTPQYTLTTLVEELAQRAAAGETQEDLIGWLYALTSGLGIRMRYDVHDVIAAPESAVVAAPDVVTASESAVVAAPDVITAPVPGEKTSTSVESNGDTLTSVRDGKKKVTRIPVPVSVVRGRMTIHFSDSALQLHDPPAGGRFDHLADDDTYIGRIILSCDRRNIRVDAPLCAECNGAVINARTWELLVVPPRAFAPRPSAARINRGLASVVDKDDDTRGTGVYDIIQVSDGTVVNLYCWIHPVKGPIWCLASSNGYDVSHLKWMGAKTYAEIVYELLQASHPEFAAATGMTLERAFLCEGDSRLNFELLDKTRCYTIGFRHGDFHPMGADPSGIWNIQTANLATGKPEYGATTTGLPHVPRQAVYTRADIIRLAKAGGRHGVGADGTAIQMADLDHISRTAFEDAKAVIAGVVPTVPPLPASLRDEGIHVCPFNYGFILRSRDPEKTGAYSDVLCESPLLRRVRQLAYRRPSRQVRDELDESSRLEYSALKAFLTTTDRDDFLALFPEFAPRFAIYREFVANVIHLVLHMHRQNAMAPSSRSSSGSQPKTRTRTVAQAMLTHIICHEKDFKAFNADAESIVNDFVVRPEYAVLYMRAIGLPTANPQD